MIRLDEIPSRIASRLMPLFPTPNIIVCPRCHYGYCDPGGGAVEFVCPQAECGHQWEVLGQTIRAVQGTERRRAVFEIAVIAGGVPARVVLESTPAVIGRDPGCTVVLDNLSVSRRHAEIVAENNTATVRDLKSSCGTAVNGKFIDAECALMPGDRLMLAGTTLQFDVRYEAMKSPKPVVDNARLLRDGTRFEAHFRGAAAKTIPFDAPRLSFGRSADRDVVLSGPLISARHALLERLKDGDYLSDAQSAHGTYVNGQPIIRTRLVSGDRIQIGPYLFRYEGNRLVRTERSSAIAVSAFALCKSAGSTTLLDNLTFTLQPGEFVGLIGPSGAGKTTLLDALNGLRPATSGTVTLNGESLYESYDRLKQDIGYVPQEDTIHRELTVSQALMFAARLRLPPDTTSAELTKILDETLTALDLFHRRDVIVGLLSGGQRKRVCVGIELLSRPGVLFLDEPTSGLDPGTESRLMKLFRRLADQGQTVVCTTHVMENIDLFHKIVVLAPGGRLAYFGPPQAVKVYFGIDKCCDLYDRIGSQSPEEWKSQFTQSQQYREWIAPLEKLPKPRHTSGKPESRDNESFKARMHGQAGLSNSRRDTRGLAFGVRQCTTLIARWARLQWGDRATLGVMLAQPLVITVLICAVCRDLPTIDFLLVISALWFGCSGAAQQIVKERAVYRRERMVNLRLDSYLLSKFLPLMLMTALQVMLMLGVVWLMEDSEGSWLGRLLAMVMAAWNGVGIGLLISALATNADKAMSIVPLTLIPQIVLAGVLVAIPDMNQGTQLISHVASARWAIHACEVALLNQRTIGPEILEGVHLRPLWNLYPDFSLNTLDGRTRFLEQHNDQVIAKVDEFWISLGVMSVFFFLLSAATMCALRWQDAL